MTTRRLLPLTFLFSLLGACATGTDVNRHVEQLVSIPQGVYGQTTAVDDVGDSSPTVLPMELTVTRLSSGDHVTVHSEAKRGFFEVFLENGRYQICTSFGRCTDFAIGDQQRQRMDYEMSNGVGWNPGGLQ